MADPDEPNMGLDDTDFEEFNRIQSGAEQIRAAANTTVAPIVEADKSFYQRVMDSVGASIKDIDEELQRIDDQAKTLFESKKTLIVNRQRLATQRNAARFALRHIEDSEARQQVNRG